MTSFQTLVKTPLQRHLRPSVLIWPVIALLFTMNIHFMSDVSWRNAVSMSTVTWMPWMLLTPLILSGVRWMGMHDHRPRYQDGLLLLGGMIVCCVLYAVLNFAAMKLLWRVGVMTGDIFEIKGGDMWVVVAEDAGLAACDPRCRPPSTRSRNHGAPFCGAKEFLARQVPAAWWDGAGGYGRALLRPPNRLPAAVGRIGCGFNR